MNKVVFIKFTTKIFLKQPFFHCFFFLVLKLYRRVWTNILSMLHPDVEFVKYDTVRSLLDTHRNQGIISVLLCVKGQAQPDAVRRHLQVTKNFGNNPCPLNRRIYVYIFLCRSTTRFHPGASTNQ